MKWSNLDKEWEWRIEFQAQRTKWAKVEKRNGHDIFFWKHWRNYGKEWEVEFPSYGFLSFLSNPNFFHSSFLILLPFFLSFFPALSLPMELVYSLNLSVFRSSFYRYCLLILVAFRIKEVTASPKFCPFHWLSYYWVSRVIPELGSITEQTHS